MSTAAEVVANEFETLRSATVTADWSALEACRERVQAAVDEQDATIIELRRLVAYQQAEIVDLRDEEETINLSGGDFRIERTIAEALAPIVGYDLAIASAAEVEKQLRAGGWTVIHVSTPSIRT